MKMMRGIVLGMLCLLGCGVPPQADETEVRAERQALDAKTKLCSGTRGPGGGSATCAETDGCGIVMAPDGKNYKGVCVARADKCPDLKPTYTVSDGDSKAEVKVECAKGVTTVTPPKDMGTPDKDMACFSLKKGDAILRDDRGNSYGPPTDDKGTKFVCFAADGGAYVWTAGQGGTYYTPKGDKLQLAQATISVDTVVSAPLPDAPVIAMPVASAETALQATPVMLPTLVSPLRGTNGTVAQILAE